MHCSINLNSDSTGCFYAGDIVTGNVVLELKRKQALNCDLKIIGTCKAQWSRPSPTIPYIKLYSGKIKNICITISDIFKNHCIGKSLPAGVHQYPFHFALPPDLPSSFASSIAKVFYSITVIGRPSYKLKKSVTLKVLGNINLNHIEEYLMPIEHSFQKIFRNSGKLLVNVKTYQAFAPKQVVPLEISLNNDKKVKIRKINVFLVQKLRYTVQSGYADEERKMYKKAFNSLSSDFEESCRFQLEVPELTPTSLQIKEPMVDISYVIRVEIIFPFHLDISEDIPIIITTVPVIHHDFDE